MIVFVAFLGKLLYTSSNKVGIEIAVSLWLGGSPTRDRSGTIQLVNCTWWAYLLAAQSSSKTHLVWKIKKADPARDSLFVDRAGGVWRMEGDETHKFYNCWTPYDCLLALLYTTTPWMGKCLLGRNQQSQLCLSTKRYSSPIVNSTLRPTKLQL